MNELLISEIIIIYSLLTIAYIHLDKGYLKIASADPINNIIQKI